VLQRGWGVDWRAREAVVEETRDAFRLYVDVYSEEGRLRADAARGAMNVVSGYIREQP